MKESTTITGTNNEVTGPGRKPRPHTEEDDTSIDEVEEPKSSAAGAHHAETGDEEEGTKEPRSLTKAALQSTPPELHNHSHRKP
jgi:hypothetical protein